MRTAYGGLTGPSVDASLGIGGVTTEEQWWDYLYENMVLWVGDHAAVAKLYYDALKCFDREFDYCDSSKLHALLPDPFFDLVMYRLEHLGFVEHEFGRGSDIYPGWILPWGMRYIELYERYGLENDPK